MTGALYTIKINGGDSYHSYTSTVIWDKKGKVLTDFCATTGGRECRDATDDEIRPLDGVSVRDESERFKSYKGKNLRIRLCTSGPETSCTKEITLSGFEMARVPDKNPGFFRYQSKYSECKEGLFMQEVFFEVQNLTEWVYYEMEEKPCVNVSKDFGNRSEGLSEWLKDNKKSWFASLGAGLFCVKLRDPSPEKFDFKYLNEDFALTLYDKHTESRYSPFCFSYDRKCYFGITSPSEHDKEFFETLIRKITHFLSLCFGKKAVANRIWESDKQQWGWNYNPSEKESSADDRPYPCISYGTIRDKFEEKLKAWLLKYECYGTIIDCFFRDSPKVLPEPKTNNISAEEKRNIFETFFKRYQLLETYGNVSSKGKNTTKDLKVAIDAVREGAWSGIIRDIGWGTCVA